MTPEYIDQSADGLTLSLVLGPLDFDQFCIWDTCVKELNGVRVEARIIGASDIVTIHLPDGRTFHEVLACQRPTEQGWTQDLEQLLKQRLSRTVGGYDYQMELQRCGLSRKGDAYTRAISSANGNVSAVDAIGMVQEFPGKPDLITPVTSIEVTQSPGDALHIRTVHSYPSHDEFVMSSSTLRF